MADHEPGDVWLERVDGELQVAFLASSPNVLPVATARDLAVEIMRTLVNPIESAQLANALLRAADDAEALAGIDLAT